MFNDETFGLVNMNSSVETEEETSTNISQTTASTSRSLFEPQTYVDDSTYDDYSVTPNYSEEQSYNSTSLEEDDQFEEDQQPEVRRIYMPTIKRQEEKHEETVNLIKTREKITLAPRMKIAISAFATIMVALLFLIIFNYASLGSIRATADDRRVTISSLQNDITKLRGEYNLKDNEEALKLRAEEAGFVEIDETNSVTIKLGEYYTEDVVESLPSNWFNDVCEFFSKLFA